MKSKEFFLIYDPFIKTIYIDANPLIFLFYKCRFSTNRVKKESIDVDDY